MKPSLGLFLFTICFLFEKNLFKCEKDEISNYSPAPIDNSQFSKNNLYCDFSRKNCSWRASGLWQWDRGNSENLQLDGPLSRGSFYIYTPLVANFNLNNKKTKGPQKEFLTSPELDAPKKNVVCLSFNYYTYLTATSNDGIKLFLLSVDEKNKTEIWSHGNSEIDDWLEAKVDVVTNAKYKLSFEAYGRKGFVGLERFRIDSGYCKNGMCDFESGMCRDWTVDSQPDGNNFVVTQAGRTTFTNPIDHTSHSGFGHFAYAKNPLTDPLHARLISPKMDHLDKQCFRFSFMRTNTDVQLVLFKKYSVNDSYSEIWRSNYTHLIDQWSTVQQTITIGTPIQLILDADFAGKPKKNTQIAVDDISMISYACDDLTSCNFVRTYCGWEANRTVGFEWSVGKGRVERADKLRKKSMNSYSTLLYSDFTTLEDGETESMEIISPAIEAANPPDHGNCMSFDYKVLDIGKDDQFTLIQIDMLGERKVLWNFADTKKSSSENIIRDELVFIPNAPNLGTSRLAFRLTSSNPYTRIGIDRVQMRSGSKFCRNLPGIPTIPTPSPTPSTVPTQNPFKALNCDFEENTLCTWKSSDPPNRYRVITGDSIPKHNRKYFPDRDHTTLSNKGHYAYMFNLKNSGILVNATLTAPYPNVKASQVDLCIDFSYYFYTSGDENDASLTLDTSTTSTVVWQAPFGISNKWHRVRFTYVKSSQVYNSITFRTTLVQGMFAIDDVNITTGYCIRDEKLQQDVVSDFEDQKASNLEPTFYSGVQKWKIYKGSDVGIPDHTTHSLNGHYYGLAFSDIPEDSHKWNANSEVQTQFDQVGQNRCIRFSYYLGNLNPNTTTFGYEIETKSTQMSAHVEIFKGWEISGDTNKLWFSHHIPIAWSSYYRIRFFIKNIGEFTKDVRGSLVFIDDFTLSPSSCLAKGCNFEDGNTCSMEVMPVSKYKLSRAVSQRLSHQSNGSVLTNIYLNDYVDQIWQIFAPVQEDPTDHYYPARSVFGRLSKSFLLMTADSDWQRAIITTESYTISKFKTGLKSQMCLSFYIHKPESSNSVLQIYQGDSLLKTSVLIFSMTRASQGSWSHNGWEKINILVEKNNNQNMDVSFYFVGTIGNGVPSSYIAIDEVDVTDQCDGMPNNVLPTDSPVTDSHGNTILQPTNSPSTTFTCKDGNVIPISKVCDNQDDCKGSEDEMNCGSRNFKEVLSESVKRQEKI